MDASQLASGLRIMIRGEVRTLEPLAPLTTIRVGGPADVLVYPEDEEDLSQLLQYAGKTEAPVFLLGQGSNILVPDAGLRGMVAQLGRMSSWAEFDDEWVSVGAGYLIPRLVSQAANRGLSGLEGLAGVPGSVGGALYMNAGTVHGTISGVVAQVQIIEPNGRIRWLDRDEMGFAYRTSILQKEPWIALSARLKLEPRDPEEVRRITKEHQKRRSQTQPLRYHNAGSIFRNPPGDHAGRLIEAAGLKGRRQGQAEISSIHANFIVNHGGATAEDVLALMVAAYQTVRDRFGARLVPEIRLLAGNLTEWQNRTEA